MAKYRRKHFFEVAENGLVTFDDKPSFLLELDKRRGKRGYVLVATERKKMSRGLEDETGNQAGYYFGVLVKRIAHDQGLFPDEVHENLKRKFLRIGGTDDYPKLQEFSDLDTKQAEEYFAQIRMHASIDLGLYLPLPNEEEEI